jgi:hypothetical protein
MADTDYAWDVSEDADANIAKLELLYEIIENAEKATKHTDKLYFELCGAFKFLEASRNFNARLARKYLGELNETD